MALRNRTAERNRRIALKAWLREADAWDGKAVAFHPVMKRYVDMDEYKRRAAEPHMSRVDAMPPEYRELVHEFQDYPTIEHYHEMRMPASHARAALERDLH